METCAPSSLPASLIPHHSFDYASDPHHLPSTYALPTFLPSIPSYALYAQITSICRSFLCRQGAPIPTRLVSASCSGLKVWENELEIVCRTRRLVRFREQAPFPIWGSSGRVTHVVALRLLCGANGSFDSSLTGTVRTSKQGPSSGQFRS